MSLNFKEIISNIFHNDENEKAEEEKKSAQLQQKLSNVLGVNQNFNTNAFNPFLKKNGELLNPLLNYQKLLDNPSISQTAKNYIKQATGLSPTVSTNTTSTTSVNAVTPNVTSTQTSNTTVIPSNKTVATGSIGTYTPSGSKSQTASASNTGNTIADAAQKYIGTPYVWGGESMSEGGMDCSGFVYNALKDAGYNVGRTTAQGYRSQGSKVSKSDMQPGDLIFFGKNDNATHIGIYIGNGQMIHSSGGSKNTKSNPGKGVSIANVDHRSDFIEARRY